MVSVEPAFPRGKKEPTYGQTNRIKKPKPSVKKYGATILPEAKTRRLRPEQRRQALLNEKRMDETEPQQALNAAHIPVGKLPIGILMLACVKRITKTDIELSLPGCISGSVPISNISDAYSSRLREMIKTGATDCPSLNDLYSCGDLVYAKLLKKRDQKGSKSIFSLNPSDLHKQFVPSQLVPGLVLAATIVRKEDHGYTMNVGIRFVRAFLPDENLGQNRDDVGRNLFCSIESVSQVVSGATIILKAFAPDDPRVLNVEAAAIETIVPGCRLMFTVGEPVKFGLKGMLFEDMVPAYVNETVLTKVTSTPEKYSMFKKIPATLLYVMPVTKQVFVSLRPYPNNRAETNVTNGYGTIIEKAYVKAVNGSGVWLRFGNKHRALLPRDFIKKQAALSGNVDFSVVLGNFQIGTTYKIFVINHFPLEDTYIVTNDDTYTDEKILTPEDIIMGNTYKCRVHKVVNSGVFVTVGNVRGSLTFGYYDRQKPLKVGDILLARAVNREREKDFIRFTNHPALLDEKANILHDWDQLDATKNDQSFLGLVSKITPTIVFVKFFDGLCGVLEKTQRNTKMDGAKVVQLRLDTVVEFTVTEFDKSTKRIFLTIPKTDEKIHSAIVANATVTCVHATGVDVRTEDGETGTIPSDCFSEFGEHNSLYMRLLQEGETITVVETNPGTYSFRLISYFKTHPMHIESVESGMLLKGSCITVNGALFVTPLLNNFSEQIEINTKENYRRVEDGSIVMMRVLNVNKSANKGYELNFSTGLDNVCENGIFDVYNFMAEYLKDVQNLVERYKEAKHAFANYTIGQHVECVIESIVPESNKLAVVVHATDKKSKYAAKGIAIAILPDQPASSYKVGKKVPGRVVWIDVERKLVHVCLDQPLFDRILLRDMPVYTKYPKEAQPCWVLFANNYVRICCLKSGTPTMLIVPVKHHYNDMIDSANNTNNSLEVRLVKQLGQMIVASLEQFHQFYYTCRVQSRATVGVPRVPRSNCPLIRCRQTTETLDESSMLEEEETDVTDESDYDSDGDKQQGRMETVDAEQDGNGEEADVSHDSMDGDEDEDYVYHNDETDDESIPPTTTYGARKGKQQQKGSTIKPSSNGNDKSKLKRKIVADVKESAPPEQLPMKKKKKKISPVETLETAADVKLPKKKLKKAKKISMQQDLNESSKKKAKKTKPTKKSILLIGKATA